MLVDKRQLLRSRLRVTEEELKEARIDLKDREQKAGWVLHKLRPKTHAFTRAVANYDKRWTPFAKSGAKAVPEDEEENSEHVEELALRKKDEWSYGLWLQEYSLANTECCVAMEQVAAAEKKKYALVQESWALECDGRKIGAPLAKPFEFEM